MIIWIHGKSCVGKTLIAKQLVKKIRAKKINIVHIDGDNIRKITNNFDYSKKGRYNNANLISKLVLLLYNNKINVVVSTISIFPKLLEWNRRKMKNYFEILIKVKKNLLYERDKKRDKDKVYFKKKIKNINVVGEDIKYNYPKKVNLIIYNNSNKKIFLKNIDKILKSKKIKFF